MLTVHNGHGAGALVQDIDDIATGCEHSFGSREVTDEFNVLLSVKHLKIKKAISFFFRPT